MSSKTFSFNFSQSAKMPKNFLLNSANCACVVKYYGTHTTYGYIPDAIDTAINAIQSLINSGADDELIASDDYTGQNSLLVPIRQKRNSVEWGLTEVTIKVINRIDVTVYDFSEVDEDEIITTPELIDEVLLIPAQENMVKPINNTTWQPISSLETVEDEVIE
jgi:hypothetical protein